MVLKVFNTLTRKKEELKPINKNEVGIYSCGPTVYAPPHIGNYRYFVIVDLLKRYLEFKGFKVKHIMNLTDIDDKTIRDSGKAGVTLEEHTKKYTDIFFEGLDALNIERAWKYPKATEHVQDMIEFVRELVKKGFAYEKGGSVYFDISKFKNYGKLSGLDLSKIKLGATVAVDEYDKDNPQDFALMKKATTEELKRGIFYDTEWGKVRPGWHIECSVMSIKYLGTPFDIHMGGVDLIFPHHENEVAQSEAYSGKKFVNYWVHSEHLMIEGQKMSKSLGNYLTLLDLLDKGYEPLAIRYLLLSSHYKEKLNFTFDGLDAAKKTIDRLVDFVSRLKEVREGKTNPEVKQLIDKTRKGFEEHMDDNLNISNALASVFNFESSVNRLMAEDKVGEDDAKDAVKLILDIDKVLGLKLDRAEKKLSAEAEKLIQEREDARKKGDFKKSDEIRKELEEKFGIVLEDKKEGVRWKKK